MSIEYLKEEFFLVEETNNCLRRTKIHKNIDGVDWFRYSMPLRTYTVVTYTVLGTSKVIIDGEWEVDGDYLESKAYVSMLKEGVTAVGVIDDYWVMHTAIYDSLEAAEVVVAVKNEEARQMDMPK
jgi:hypothetical protein